MAPDRPLPGMRARPDLPVVIMLAASWVGMLGLVAAGGNARLFLTINRMGGPGWDAFFGTITHLGDGVAMGLGAVIALLARARGLAFRLAAGWGLSAALAQILKRGVFTDWLRPKAYFDRAGQSWRTPADPWGMALHSYNSFPSGHATTALCLALLLALALPRETMPPGRRVAVQGVLLALGWLIAASRVVVGQHFPLDVLAGALLGAVSAAGVVLLWRWVSARWPALHGPVRTDV